MSQSEQSGGQDDSKELMAKNESLNQVFQLDFNIK